MVKSIQLYKVQEQLRAGLALLSGVEAVVLPAFPGEASFGVEEATVAGANAEVAPRRTMIKKEARVAKVTLDVDRFIESHKIPCLQYDASSMEGGNPFDTVRPPSNFQLRAKMCGLDPDTLVKCLFLLVTATPPGQEPKAGEGALTLVRVVIPPAGYLNFEVITARLRVELGSCGCDVTKAMLREANGKLILQVAAAKHLHLLEKGIPEGKTYCTAEDLRQCALNYKICCPLGPPKLLTLIAAESAGDEGLLFESGFGRYVTIKGKDLVSAIGAHVVDGLIKDESAALPYTEL